MNYRQTRIDIKRLLDEAFELHQKANRIEAKAAKLRRELHDHQRADILANNILEGLSAEERRILINKLRSH